MGCVCNLRSFLPGGRETLCGPGEGLHPPAMVGQAKLVLAGTVAEMRAEVYSRKEGWLTDNGGAPPLSRQGHGERGPISNGDVQLVTEPAAHAVYDHMAWWGHTCKLAYCGCGCGALA